MTSPTRAAWSRQVARSGSSSLLRIAVVVPVIPGGVLLGARLGAGFAAVVPMLNAAREPSEGLLQVAVLAAVIGAAVGAVWGFVSGMLLAAALAPLVVLGCRLGALVAAGAVALGAASAPFLLAIPDPMLAIWFLLAIVQASGGIVAIDWLSRRIRW